MPRDSISKYWRRIRHEARHNQIPAASERHEPDQGSKVGRIATALHGIKEELSTSNNQNTPEKQRERCWKIWEVLGIWAAAVVGLTAIAWSAWDSSEERGLMQGQIDEMRHQREMTAAQLRANVNLVEVQVLPVNKNGNSVQPGEPIAYYAVTPIWKNLGATNAIGHRAWFGLPVSTKNLPVNVAEANPDNCPKIPKPHTPRHFTGDVVGSGMWSAHPAKYIAPEIAEKARQGKALIWFVGHDEYRDAFPGTPVHHGDWCNVFFPSDLAHGGWPMFRIRDSAT
jgi:hypothetical protein